MFATWEQVDNYDDDTDTNSQNLQFVNVGTPLPNIAVTRVHPIHSEVAPVNDAVHALFTQQAPNSVWQYYKLIGVQAQPMNGPPPSTALSDTLSYYYLANIVVETNQTLQNFFGKAPNGLAVAANNVYLNGATGSPFQMGGCQGCHGTQGQALGGDFSAVLGFAPYGSYTQPDSIDSTPVGSLASYNARTRQKADSFLSYKSKPAKVSGKTFTWVDVLGNGGTAAVGKTANLANPAGVGTGTPNSDVSLVGYELKKGKKLARKLSVSNDLGTWAVKTLKPKRILSPASVTGGGSPDAPVLTNQGIVDDYVCYTTKITSGKKKLKGVTALLEEKVNGQGRTYKVTKPTQLCVPADSQGDGIQRSYTYLMCYGVKPIGGKHIKMGGIGVNSQLAGTHTVSVKMEEEYCVPSTVAAR